MQELLTYIENNDWLLAVVLFGSLTFCWILEAIAPLAAFGYRKLRHIGVNTVLLTSTAIVSAPLITLHGVAFLWLEANQFGVLNLIDLPIWAELLIAVMALDFIAQYGTHFLLHRVKWMWRMQQAVPTAALKKSGSAKLRWNLRKKTSLNSMCPVTRLTPFLWRPTKKRQHLKLLMRRKISPEPGHLQIRLTRTQKAPRKLSSPAKTISIQKLPRRNQNQNRSPVALG